MSAELWRVLHDLEVAFVAVTCSHVSASVVELLMPQYSADRNKALQMVEGILGVGFHWMLGVQLFRMLVPLRYENFPGTVFTVFAPMLLRHQYTKLLVAVQSLAGQTLRLLPTALGDDRGPVDKSKRARGTVQPLTPDMSTWQQALDDLEKSILFEMREVLAKAQKAYVDGSKERLDAENKKLRDVFNEGVSDLTDLIQQGNDIGSELLDMAKARQNAVQQWQVQQKWQAFKDAANQVATEIGVQLTAIEQSIEQMKAMLMDLSGQVYGLEQSISKWREGGPPENLPDDPIPTDPSDPPPGEPSDYPFTTYIGGRVAYVVGPTNDMGGTLAGAEKLGLYDECGLLRQDSIDPSQVYTWNSDGTYSKWQPPRFFPGSYAGRGEEAYYNGWDVRIASSGPKKGATKDVCNIGNKCISLANPEPHDCPKDEYHTFG